LNKWRLQKVRNRFSEMARKVLNEGPQVITLGDSDAMVVVDADEYARITRKPKDTLVDFLRKSPLDAVELDLERNLDVSDLAVGDLKRRRASRVDPWLGK
jgi:antitoxin Phd_YefM of type II toxin-antitoxin system